MAMKANYLKLDQGVPVKIHYADMPVDNHFYKLYKKGNTEPFTATVTCVFCEEEKIESRFEILDL